MARAIHRLKLLAREGIKYGAVGLFGAVLHLSIITLAMQMASVPYWAGFLAGLPFTYSTKFLLNKYWTFHG